MSGNKTVAGYSEKWTTLEAILNHGRRNKQHTSAEFTCHVQVKRIRNNQEWFTLTCGGGGCMKGLVHEDYNMWCDGCENPFSSREQDVLPASENVTLESVHKIGKLE